MKRFYKAPKHCPTRLELSTKEKLHQELLELEEEKRIELAEMGEEKE